MGDTVAQWTSRANNGVKCGEKSKTSNVAQNMLVTKSYAEMYLSNPRVFKWAGMAAFASNSVGMGIIVGKATDLVVDGQVRSMEAQSMPYSEAFKAPKERVNATDLDNLLIDGNKAVYRDIYWQHLVYREEGLEELLRLLKSAAPRGVDLLIQGWTEIDKGAKRYDSGAVWHGNESLLKYEQYYTLQPYYDKYPSTADILSYALISPLPNQAAPFKWDFPTGSVRDFRNRWTWISQRLLPWWKKLDEGGDLETRMLLLAMGSTSKPMVCYVY
ncbi:MAG TPA: hypothetical protein VJR89_05260 [Polyangiales bacterium]|nr:hypothetical protein [Polyangiales bacterium]